jgi:hypothetical protein
MSNLGNLSRHCFWCACWSETRQANIVSVLDECCSLCSGDSCKCHKALSITQFFKICAKVGVLFGLTKKEAQKLMFCATFREERLLYYL